MNGNGMPFVTGEPMRRAANGDHKHRPARAVHFPDDTNGGTHRLPWGGGNNSSRFFHAADEEQSILDLIFGLIMACLATISVGGLLTLLAVLYLTVRPFSANVYRRLSSHLAASSFLDAMALLLPNTRLVVTGDSDIPTPVGASLLVSNHLVDADWWALLMLGRCVGLGGTMKVFLRNEYLGINLNDSDRSSRQSSSPLTSSSPLCGTRGSTSGSVLSTALHHHQNNSLVPSDCPSSTPIGGPRKFTTPPHIPDPPAHDLVLMAKLLHLFLEFPLLNGEESGGADREQLLTLLRSLGEGNAAETAPVHLLFFPEGWSLHNMTDADRQSVLAKSNDFARREGKPQLKHLLLPRTRAFNSCLECLRESNPVVYDVTMAYVGYNGSLPPSNQPLSVSTLFFKILRRKFPKEVHIRIKRYSMEEVLHIDNVNWLVKRWAEKDRLLSHFARHQQFPTDSRGYYGRPRVFSTRYHSMENSISALFRLLLLPSAVPFLAFVAVPLSWTVLWIWVVTKGCQWLFSYISGHQDNNFGNGNDIGAGGRNTPGSVPSSSGTPFFPATPFASPIVWNWKDMFSNGEDNSGRGTRRPSDGN